MSSTVNIVEQLKDLLDSNKSLCRRLQQRLQHCAQDNPDPLTNPVHSLDDLYCRLERFLTSMPWGEFESKVESRKSKEQGLFRRIDQATGYIYYLFGDLQYEPAIADWIKQYNALWGEFLNSSESWNNDYYEMLKSDPLFELDTDKYEPPANWHSWNDFFSRSLENLDYLESLENLERLENLEHLPPLAAPAEGRFFGWTKISEDSTLPCTEPIKTATVFDIKALLGNSSYRNSFADGRFGHITLDIYNYHRFHSPCEGTIVDIQEIDGQLSAGGKIIWDKAEHRYRYEQADNIGYQMIEKRVVIVIESGTQASTPAIEQGTRNKEKGRLIAIIPVGVAQVGSIKLNEDIIIGAEVRKHQELGCFLCGGSDIIILTN